MQYPNACLLMMAKAPVAGYAKTRLIPALGAEGAAKLQHYLIERQLQQAFSTELAPIELWCAGECNHPLFATLQQRYGIAVRRQSGNDLGERMAFALSAALERTSSAIIIGSDIPELSGEVLAQAFQALGEGADAVVVPAEDGGYALLGLHHVAPELFTGIDWGSEKVMAQTRERLRGLGWHWVELSPLWDLDRPEDLERFISLGDIPDTVRRLVTTHNRSVMTRNTFD